MRRNSLFSTTFSKDVIKIRADVLKSIPLNTNSETPNTSKPILTTSASISSTDSVKSNKSASKIPCTTTLTNARQKYQRRKSVSLDHPRHLRNHNQFKGGVSRKTESEDNCAQHQKFQHLLSAPVASYLQRRQSLLGHKLVLFQVLNKVLSTTLFALLEARHIVLLA